MMDGPWYYLLYLYGVFVDALSVCDSPVKLHASELNRDQYLGRWFFIAAASSSTSSLATFTSIDSILFRMTQSNSHERLQLQAALRLKTGQCVPRSWVYLLKEENADLATEGRSHMRTELFSAKCPDSIIVQETDQDYQRILLYSRVLHPAEDCIEDFKDKAFCLDMDEFLLIPRTQGQGYCLNDKNNNKAHHGDYVQDSAEEKTKEAAFQVLVNSKNRDIEPQW